MLPLAPGANGHPPRPPIEASSRVTPALTAAYALARPAPRVLWKCAPSGTAAMRGRAERNDFVETLKAFDKPALVIAGDHDAFDGGAAQRMTEMLPNGELAVISNSGHTPNMENPAEFDAALGAFLSRLV